MTAYQIEKKIQKQKLAYVSKLGISFNSIVSSLTAKNSRKCVHENKYCDYCMTKYCLQFVLPSKLVLNWHWENIQFKVQNFHFFQHLQIMSLFKK